MPRVTSTGSNLLEPGSLTSVLPLIGWITTLLLGTGVGGGGCWETTATATADERDVVDGLPAASVARTKNVYAPGASPLKFAGDAQGANVPGPAGPSRRQSNLVAASVELNVHDTAGPGGVADRPQPKP